MVRVQNIQRFQHVRDFFPFSYVHFVPVPLSLNKQILQREIITWLLIGGVVILCEDHTLETRYHSHAKCLSELSVPQLVWANTPHHNRAAVT